MQQTVLVTGSARRIGRGIALDFAAQGFNVCIHYYNSKDEAESLAREIHALGRKAYLVQADLSCEEEVLNIFPKILQDVEKITVLVNNASTFKYDNVKIATRSSWDYHLEPNLRAPFTLAQEFAKQTAEGLIINIIDQRVWNLTPHYLSYSLSKFGLWGLTQTLALALAPHIRVNAIGPGPTLRNETQTDKQFIEQCLNTPLKRGGNMEEICAAARFFVTAKSVTGQMIAVDGGQHLGWMTPKDTAMRED